MNNKEIEYLRLMSLRIYLQDEIRGIKKLKPTAYIQVKREFNIHGSRKRVLEQLSAIIEDFNGNEN